MQATGGSISSTCSDIQPQHLGTCARFEERQIGGDRFNFFEGCPAAKTCTLVLRGGAEQFIAEVERSLHDAIMIVKRAIKNRNIVAGGGACEVIIPHPSCSIFDILSGFNLTLSSIDGNLSLPPSARRPLRSP